MKIDFHYLAYQELDDSAAYYDSVSPGLGAEFIATQKTGFKRIMDHPEAWPAAIPDLLEIRYIYTKRFGFKLFYRIDPDVIYILAVAHSARKPLYWIDRLES